MSSVGTEAPDLRGVLLGATGAVGSHVARTCAEMSDVSALTLLGRRPLEGLEGEHVTQARIDIFDRAFRIDRTAVLDFAAACKALEGYTERADRSSTSGAMRGASKCYSGQRSRPWRRRGGLRAVSSWYRGRSLRAR